MIFDIQEMLENLETFIAAHCLDCDIDTFEIGEYYMLKDPVWEEAVPDDDLGMLCIGCIEKKLGRELSPEDFSECPLNTEEDRSRSERYAQRLAHDRQAKGLPPL